MTNHSSMFIIFLHTFSIVTATNPPSTWLSPSPTMPRPDKGFAVGWYNDTIYIAGGSHNSFQFLSFNIFSETFSDHGENLLSNGYKCDAQGYTQKDDILYMINGGASFRTYDMKNDIHTDYWMEISFTETVGYHGCLASSEDHLYVVGGWSMYTSYHAFLQVLSLSTYEWIPNTPSMTVNRGDSACIIHSDYLWVFGGCDGLGDDEYHASNERISIIDITQNAWDDTIPTLADAALGLGVAVSGDDIYIIGGHTTSTPWILDTVQIMDTITVQIRTSIDRLAYDVGNIGVVSLGYAIYAFGGDITRFTEQTDRWMWHSLPTQSPVVEPSAAPSETTAEPSVPPSNVPTGPPSQAPTLSTEDPTETPVTRAPTIAPTESPVTTTINVAPTQSPSESISITSTSPSHYPSTSPYRSYIPSVTSIDPTSNPFQSLFITPTEAPTETSNIRVTDNGFTDGNPTFISIYGVLIIVSVSVVICSALTVCIVSGMYMFFHNKETTLKSFQMWMKNNGNGENDENGGDKPSTGSEEAVPGSENKADVFVMPNIVEVVEDGEDDEMAEDVSAHSNDSMYNNEGIQEVNDTMGRTKRKANLDDFAQKVGIAADKFIAAGLHRPGQIIEMVQKGKMDLLLNAGILTVWEIHCLQEYVEKKCVEMDLDTHGVTQDQQVRTTKGITKS